MKHLHRIAAVFVLLSAFALSVRAVPKGGALDPTFNPGSWVDGEVYCLALQPNGKIVIGGALSTGVARLNSDGSADTNFQAVVSGGLGQVLSCVLQSDGKIIIGGYFSVVNGTNLNSLARLNMDGTLDNGFGNGLQGAMLDGSDLGQVNSVAVQSGTNIFVGGYFNQINSTTHNGIVMLNPGGTVNTNFQDHWLGTSIPYTVAVALQPDGKVFISGDYGLVRLNPDGHHDSNFVAIVDNYVNSIVVLPDTKILIAGQFTSVNGVGCSHIARLNANGTVDTSFVADTDDLIYSIAVQPDGKVILGGLFLTVNGEARSRLARLNADGSLDASFLGGLAGANSPVVYVATQPDRRILIGGQFTAVNDVSFPYVARLYGNAPLSIDNFGIVANRFGFNINGDSNQVVVVEASTNLLNWTALKTNTLGGGPLSFSDPAAANFSKRFYRARLQ